VDTPDERYTAPRRPYKYLFRPTWHKVVGTLLLVGGVVLWLIAVLFVMVSGDSSKEKNWKDTKSAIEAAGKSPKNKSFFEPWDKYGAAATGHKDKVWEAGWKQQEQIYTWPAMEVKLNGATARTKPSSGR